jgi:ribosomal protein L40E
MRFCGQCATPLNAAKPEADAEREVEQTLVSRPSAELRDAAESEPKPGAIPARICSRCGASNPAGLRFCEQCAAPLGTTEAKAGVERDVEQTLAPGRLPESRVAVKPTSQAAPEVVKICTRCGAQNSPNMRFCEQCAASLDVTGAKPPGRRPLSKLVLGGVAGLLIIALCVLSIVLWSAFRPVTSEQAEGMADQIVQEEFPEFIGKQDGVEEFTVPSGEAYYVVSYSYMAEVDIDDQPFEIPRVLIFQVFKDSGEVFVAESN